MLLYYVITRIAILWLHYHSSYHGSDHDIIVVFCSIAVELVE